MAWGRNHNSLGWSFQRNGAEAVNTPSLPSCFLTDARMLPRELRSCGWPGDLCVSVFLLHYTHSIEEMLCFLSIFELNRLCSNYSKFKIWKQQINLSLNMWNVWPETDLSIFFLIPSRTQWLLLLDVFNFAGDWTETPVGTWDSSQSDMEAQCLQDILMFPVWEKGGTRLTWFEASLSFGLIMQHIFILPCCPRTVLGIVCDLWNYICALFNIYNLINLFSGLSPVILNSTTSIVQAGGQNAPKSGLNPCLG